MTVDEQKKKVNHLLNDAPVEGVKHIKKNDGLFERKRIESSKTLITEDNKILLND